MIKNVRFFKFVRSAKPGSKKLLQNTFLVLDLTDRTTQTIISKKSTYPCRRPPFSQPHLPCPRKQCNAEKLCRQFRRRMDLKQKIWIQSYSMVVTWMYSDSHLNLLLRYVWQPESLDRSLKVDCHVTNGFYVRNAVSLWNSRHYMHAVSDCLDLENVEVNLGLCQTWRIFSQNHSPCRHRIDQLHRRPTCKYRSRS
jgi:hypothetical protein